MLPAESPTEKQPAVTGARPRRVTMEEQLSLFKDGELFPDPKAQGSKIKRSKQPKEWKLIALRECPTPENMMLCDTPERAAEYWKIHVKPEAKFDPERECFVIMFLNTRRRVRGHQFLSHGTLDTILVHPREVFRVAITMAAAAVVLMHNHPSGEPEPSEADIKVTRDLIRGGQLLKIEVLDHVIVGNPKFCSLRELGYFYD